MTETQDLITRLRHTATKGVSVWGDLQMEAANQLEIFAAESEIYISAMDRMKVALDRLREAEPTIEDAHAMGAKGAEPTESERLLFEAWMKGHCWAIVGDWNGSTYMHETEKVGTVQFEAMSVRRLWAAWRDRAALAKVKKQS